MVRSAPYVCRRCRQNISELRGERPCSNQPVQNERKIMNSNVTMMGEPGQLQHLAKVRARCPHSAVPVFRGLSGVFRWSNAIPKAYHHLPITWGNSTHLHPTPTHGRSCPDGFHVVDSFERNLIRTTWKCPNPVPLINEHGDFLAKVVGRKFVFLEGFDVGAFRANNQPRSGCLRTGARCGPRTRGTRGA
jgi:hypothetical protein